MRGDDTLLGFIYDEKFRLVIDLFAAHELDILL